MFAPWRSQNPVHKTWVSDYLETGTVQSIHVPSTSILLVSGGGGVGRNPGVGGEVLPGSPPLTKRIEALGTRMDCTVPVSKEGTFFFREFRFLLSRVC